MSTSQAGQTSQPTVDRPVKPTGTQPRDSAARESVLRAAEQGLAGEWITELGRQLVRSIENHHHVHHRYPTWAKAIAGVDDQQQLEPLHSVPESWPLQPAAWRRELLMVQLKKSRWITYTRTPRSLRPGDRGHRWLTSTVSHRTTTQ